MHASLGFEFSASARRRESLAPPLSPPPVLDASWPLRSGFLGCSFLKRCMLRFGKLLGRDRGSVINYLFFCCLCVGLNVELYDGRALIDWLPLIWDLEEGESNRGGRHDPRSLSLLSPFRHCEHVVRTGNHQSEKPNGTCCHDFRSSGPIARLLPPRCPGAKTTGTKSLTIINYSNKILLCTRPAWGGGTERSKLE